MENKKVLNLTLSRLPFEVMVTGEKKLEFRNNTTWLMRRLFDSKSNVKHYDLVKFVNGYGNDKPYFICEFKNWIFSPIDVIHRYSNGLTVAVEKGDVIIELGDVIETGNLKN